MVRHTALRKIICPNLLRTISCSNLAPSGFRLRIMGFLTFNIIKLCPEQCKSLGLILKLRFLCLTVHYNSCRIMGQAHCGVCGIDALTSISGSTHNVNTDVFIINLYVYLLRLRHHSYCNRRGMNPTP